MDAVTWAREGLIDMLIPASVWRPSDTDQPLEEWRRRIGPDSAVAIAPGTDLWLQGAPGGLLMMNDIESVRGFTAAMLDRGADLIYLFNHFHHNTFNRAYEQPDGTEVVWNDYQDILRQAGRMETVLDKPRRHVLTWHDPAPPAERTTPASSRPLSPSGRRPHSASTQDPPRPPAAPLSASASTTPRGRRRRGCRPHSTASSALRWRI
jgi:hypothetical protein